MTPPDVDRGAELGAALETHRRALTVHCYRFLGSLHDAEEATQETYLRAWHRRETFRGDASLQTWLYRIATRVCLDAIEKRKRRILPATAGPATRPGTAPEGSSSEISWLEPVPSNFVADSTLDPASAYSLAESVRLAFIAALQTLPPRQRAVLILRDVLTWSAAETAAVLDMSSGAANSALHRARQRLRETYHRSPTDAITLPDPVDPDVVRLLDTYVRAWEHDDVEALVTTLREDARLAMPPSPSWYEGRADVIEFLRAWVMPQGSFRLEARSANAQPAFLFWIRQPDGVERAIGLMVLTLDDRSIREVDVFMSAEVIEAFAAAPARASV